MSTEPKPADPPRKSRLVPILLSLILVLALGGGAGAYWMLAQRGGGEQAEAEPPADPGLVSFDTFVVNLADGNGRFLRVTLTLLLDDAHAAEEIADDAVTRVRLRSAILELLTQQTAEGLTTPEGKAALKTAIAERAAHVLEHTQVTDVLFTEFVVQF